MKINAQKTLQEVAYMKEMAEKEERPEIYKDRERS